MTKSDNAGWGPGKRKWQVVVDFSIVASVSVGVLIGVFAALM
jgi:hypothetical protein